MHDYYSETSLRASNEMTKPNSLSRTADRDGLTLEFATDENAKRSRIVSLSDLALEALSPIYSTAVIDATRTGSHLMTPTPTQFLFPRSVTAEQEAYASGFARALEEIYRTQGQPVGNDAVTRSVNEQQAAANSLSNGLMPTAGNCGVWQRAVVNHTATLHYIPESSVSTSTAPVNMYGEISTAQHNGTGARLDYGTALAASFQPSSMALDSAGNQATNTSTNSMSSVVRSCAFTDCISSNQMRSSIVSTVGATSAVVPCFNSVASSVPSSLPSASSAGSYFSNTGIMSSVSCVPVVSSNLFTSELLASNSFSSFTAGESSQILSTESTQSSLSSSASSPRIALDMQEQDRWRLERKRAKNRVAAARCQMRKLERIAKLEDKARDLRNYNAQLSQTAAALHEHVAKLQKQILSHTERGCRLLIPSIQ